MKTPRKTKQQNLEAKLYSIREIYVYNSQTMRYLFENFLFLVWITVRMISQIFFSPHRQKNAIAVVFPSLCIIWIFI